MQQPMGDGVERRSDEGTHRPGRRLFPLRRSVASSAITTCPAPIFCSNDFVGIQPTIFPCCFCKRSMNGRSSAVATRTETGERGTGGSGMRVHAEIVGNKAFK